MEKDRPANPEYQGDSPRWAAAKTFFATAAFWTIGFELAWHVIAAVFTKTKPSQMIDNLAVEFKRTWPWHLGFGGILGALDAKDSYDKAKAAQSQHNKLVHDNIAMRAQLNQTGQILRHVADEVGKGTLADSQMTLDASKAPATHVARLEAANAAAEAQTALAKL